MDYDVKEVNICFTSGSYLAAVLVNDHGYGYKAYQKTLKVFPDIVDIQNIAAHSSKLDFDQALKFFPGLTEDDYL